jgi:hypothetical protein
MVGLNKHNWQVFKHSLMFTGKSKLEDTLICSTQMGQDPPNQHIIDQKKTFLEETLQLILSWHQRLRKNWTVSSKRQSGKLRECDSLIFDGEKKSFIGLEF